MTDAAGRHRPLVLTQGDPAGIGPELALKAWMSRAEWMPSASPAQAPFVVIADPALMKRVAEKLRLPVAIREIANPQDAPDAGDDLPVVSTGHPANVNQVSQTPGRRAERSPPSISPRASSVTDTLRRSSTNPIAKSVLYAAGIDHPGHTESLAELAQRFWGVEARPVMMLWSELLAVVPVTIHVPLRSVPDLLTTELIFETGRIVAREMTTRFGLPRPRLASRDSTRTRAKAERWVARTTLSSGRRWSNCGPKALTRSGRCPPIQCSTAERARLMTWRSACITTRRLFR